MPHRTPPLTAHIPRLTFHIGISSVPTCPTQGDEAMLIPAILGVLDDKVYRVIVRTHHVDVHA